MSYKGVRISGVHWGYNKVLMTDGVLWIWVNVYLLSPGNDEVMTGQMD